MQGFLAWSSRVLLLRMLLLVVHELVVVVPRWTGERMKAPLTSMRGTSCPQTAGGDDHAKRAAAQEYLRTAWGDLLIVGMSVLTWLAVAGRRK